MTTSPLLYRSVRAFSTLLEDSLRNDRIWRKVAEGVSRHGLLSFTVTVERQQRLPEIDVERLEIDRRYRQQIIKELQKPIAPDVQQKTIPLDRESLADPEYRRKMAGILGYRWAQKLEGEQIDPGVKLTLWSLTPEDLLESLEKLMRYQSDAETVARKILWRMAEEEMDKSPEITATFERLETKLDEIEDQFHQETDRRLAKILEDTHRRLDEITERTNQRLERSRLASLERVDEMKRRHEARVAARA